MTIIGDRDPASKFRFRARAPFLMQSLLRKLKPCYIGGGPSGPQCQLVNGMR